MWMNEMDIDQGVYTYRNDPVLGPAYRLLSDVRDLVNANSDGWPYWKAPARACRQLTTLLYRVDYGPWQERHVPTAEEIKKALPPIKAFCTRNGFSFPDYR